MAHNDNGAIAETIQSRVREDNLQGGVDILPLLLSIGDIVPAYWSRQRDVELGRFWHKSDHVGGAISMFVSKFSSIPLKVIPRDASIKTHVKQAKVLTSTIIDGSDFFAGWHESLAPRLVTSWLTKDNGMFCEVIGGGSDKSKPRQDFFGLAMLDPRRCSRTSNPEFPVIYQDTDGKLYKLHHTRVAFASSMKSDDIRLNGVGYCSLSRMVRTAQHLIDIGVYEQEKLGSRPARNMIIGEEGISAKEIVSAFAIAEQGMDNLALARYAQNVVLSGSGGRKIKIAKIPLSDIPDGFNKEMSITLGMFAIALALNIPPRWIWPASQSGATKADALFQHVAGMGGGIGHLLMVFKSMLGGGSLSTVLGKPIPSHLELVFDFQDDLQDRDVADIRKIRAETREKQLADGEIDVRVARQLALDSGDLSQSEFDDLELGDGRLPDGQETLNLFMSSDKDIQEMLALSVGDVLNVAVNDVEFVLEQVEERLIQIRAELMNPSRPAVFNKAKQAFMALEALRELYQPTTQEGGEPIEVMDTPLNLNGSQVRALRETLGEVRSGDISEANAIDVLTTLGIPEEQVRRMVQEASEGASTQAVIDAANVEVEAEVKEKESDGWFKKSLALMALAKDGKQPAPVIPPAPTITVEAPVINIDMPEVKEAKQDINISVPKQEVPVVNVQMPKQQAPTVNVTPPSAPEINVNVPETQVIVEPAIVNVDSPVVNIEPNINVTSEVTIPDSETIIERDNQGLITRAIKRVKKGKLFN